MSSLSDGKYDDETVESKAGEKLSYGGCNNALFDAVSGGFMSRDMLPQTKIIYQQSASSAGRK